MLNQIALFIALFSSSMQPPVNPTTASGPPNIHIYIYTYIYINTCTDAQSNSALLV